LEQDHKRVLKQLKERDDALEHLTAENSRFLAENALLKLSAAAPLPPAAVVDQPAPAQASNSSQTKRKRKEPIGGHEVSQVRTRSMCRKL
jgi:hypothetical protein